MAFSTKCSDPNCKSTNFEMVSIKPDNARYAIDVIRCDTCGAIAGVLPNAQISWTFEALKKLIEKVTR